jgi:two-component system cell cycle sensor histidine kinase/response regulator CckA
MAESHPRRCTLADLIEALSQSATRTHAVRETVVAATELLGDGVGVTLLRDDGRYGTVTFHHPDPEQRRLLTAALDRCGSAPEDTYSHALRIDRQPIVLSPLAPAQLADLVPVRPTSVAGLDVHAAVLCPIVTDGVYLGYLVAVRTAAGGTYLPVDVELAHTLTTLLSLAVFSGRARERLQAAEERHRHILQRISEGVLLLDSEGRVTDANEPAGVMLGRPADQVVGVPLHMFLERAEQVLLSRRLADSLVGRTTTGTVRLVRADSSHRTVRVSLSPLPDQPGQPNGSVCVMSDATDQLDARGLKRQLDHLRRLDSLGHLIGGFSHDFSNLFTVITGSAEMIVAYTEPDSPERQLATDIAQAADTGRALTHQLLAFGRTDGNRLETIPVADLLREMHPLLVRTLGEHITLEFASGTEVWPIRVERGPLEQALVNLAANARDAMPNGGVLRVEASNVEVEAAAGDTPARRMVHMVVTDTGAGMNEETRRRAFEPFFTTKPAAVGLGLTTTAGILRSIGGDITLESQPRLGTTVHLRLPAGESPTGPEATRPTVVRDVLVVEDQPDVAALVQRLCESAGYAVTVATDARTAVESVAAGANPDLLITDVVMPAMTGPELAAAIRSHCADLPVIYISGYTAAALGPQIQLDANSRLVEKPFNRSTLLGAVQTLCGPGPTHPAET